MRRLFLLCLAAGLTLAAPALSQQQDAECLATIDKAIKAQGNPDKLEKLKAFSGNLKGSMSFMEMDLDFTMELFTQLPDKAKAIIKLSIGGQEIVVTQVFNGDKGWTNAAGQTKEAEKEELAEHKAMQHVEKVTNLFDIKKDKEMKLSSLGEVKINDSPAIGVRVTKKDQRDVNLYFDKKTHLLVKAEYRAMDPFTKQDVNQEKFFTEYKELAPGYKLASKQHVKNEGKRFMDLEFTEFRPLERLEDNIFAKPD